MKNDPDSPNPRWYFPPLRRDNKDSGSTDYSEKFGERNLPESLMREICQNSLDAARSDDDPVTVKFSFGEISRSDFSEIFDDALRFVKSAENFLGVQEDGGNENLIDKVFLEKARAALEEAKIQILKISDFGTTGLEGIYDDYTNSNAPIKPWRKLVSSHGVSYKTKGSGGSKGVGKAAAWAASLAKMVFYGTRSRDGVGFQGRFRLPSLYNPADTKKQLIGDGDFCVVSEEDSPEGAKLTAISQSDACRLRDKFLRPAGTENFGTDVIIVGVKEEVKGGKSSALPRAAICNFFPAIAKNRLNVEIGGNVISSKTISDCLRALTEEAAQDVKRKETIKNRKRLLELQKTAEMLEAMRGEPEPLSVNGETNDVEIWHAPSAGANRSILFTRSAGMKITEKDVYGVYPFVAVVRVRSGTELESLLRGSEPAEHTSWIKKDQDAKTKKAIDAIFNEAEEFIRKKYLRPEGIAISGDTGIKIPGIGGKDGKGFDPFTATPRLEKYGDIRPLGGTEWTRVAGNDPGTAQTVVPSGRKRERSGKSGAGKGGGGNGENPGVRLSSLVARSFCVKGDERIFCIVVKTGKKIADLAFKFSPETEDAADKEFLRFEESETGKFNGTAIRDTTAPFTLAANYSRRIYVKFEPRDDLDFSRCAVRVTAMKIKAKGDK